jgi:hypothetical protein
VMRRRSVSGHASAANDTQTYAKLVESPRILLRLAVGNRPTSIDRQARRRLPTAAPAPRRNEPPRPRRLL